MIPQELRDLPIWSPSMTKKGKEKAPLHDVDKYHQHTNFDEAQATHVSLGVDSKHLGIMSTFGNDLVILDYDVKQDEDGMHKELSKDFLNFLRKHPTYVEWSPSGKGLHVIYKLGSRDAETLRSAQLKRKTQKDKDGSKQFTGEVFFGTGFIIITGKLMDPTLGTITEIPLETLMRPIPDLVKWTQPRKAADVTDINTGLKLVKDPNFDRADFEARLLTIPVRMNFYLDKAYNCLDFPITPTDYDHWLNIGMSLSHAAVISRNPTTEAECLDIFHNWSQTDETGYEGFDDVLTKWEMIIATTREKVEARDPELISCDFLFRLASHLRPKFVTRPVTKKGETRMIPVWTLNANLQAVYDYHGIEFFADLNDLETMFAKCNKDVVAHIFKPLHGQFRYYTAEDGDIMVSHGRAEVMIKQIFEMSNYNPGVVPSILSHALALAGSKIDFENQVNVYDRYKAYINEFPWDGKPRVDAFLKTLRFQPHVTEEQVVHHYTVLRKCFLWMVGSRYHREPSAAPCVPILVGGEATYKTTWIKGILINTPFSESNYMRMNEQIKDKKELARSFVKTIVGALEEIETVIDKPNAEKAMLTEGSVSIRPHYKNAPVNTRRNTFLLGTSNDLQMITSKHGNRRFLRMDIATCDTKTQYELGWVSYAEKDPTKIAAASREKQQLFAELKAEYYNKISSDTSAFNLPWVLTPAENKLNNDLCERASAQSGDEMLVEEFFGGHPRDFAFDPAELIGPRGGVKQVRELIKEGVLTTREMFYKDMIGFQLNQSAGASVKAPSKPAIQHKLAEYATKYTNTYHKSILVGGALISNGVINLKGRDMYIIPKNRSEDNDNS